MCWFLAGLILPVRRIGIGLLGFSMFGFKVLAPKQTEQYRENDAHDYHGRNWKEKSTVFRLYADVAG